MIPTDLSPLANHLWQSTLCVAAVWGATLALRKNRAAVRYWLWLAASVKFLIPFSLLAGIGGQLGWRPAPAIARPQFSVVVNQISRPFTVLAEVSPATAAPHATTVLPMVLLAIWLCGVALGIVFWLRSLRQIRAIQRGAKTLPLRLPIHVMSSPARLEPGVFGIRKPVLVLPDSITDRLTPAQLDAVFAHELCHVRRKDNLTAAIHMVVEIVFWFHPLVWFIRTRLLEERERACDEGVLESGSEPQVYAEGILNVCKLFLESPMACASGITGGDLRRRIEGILAHRAAHRLEFGKKLLLAALGLAAIAGPIAAGLLYPARSHAQTPPPLSFDVASVKALTQSWMETAPRRAGGRFTWTTDLGYLIGYAYRMQPFRISGPIPGSDSEFVYRVEATTSAAATDDQVRLMLRSLLTDRFKMVSHLTTKQADGYGLSRGKGSLKMHEVQPQDPAPPLPEWFHKGPTTLDEIEGKVVAIMGEPGVVSITGRRVSMPQFCEALQRQLDKPVWDETGLKGNYYFSLRYARENAPATANYPTIDAAIQEDLGLRLEKHKGPVEMLVVDHIESKPTEN